MSQPVRHYLKLAGSVVIAVAVLPLQGVFFLRLLLEGLFCSACSLRLILFGGYFDTGLPLQYVDAGMLLLAPLIGTAAVYALLRSRRAAGLLLGAFVILDLAFWLVLPHLNWI